VRELMESDFSVEYIVTSEMIGDISNEKNVPVYECSKSEGESMVSAETFSGMFAVAKQKDIPFDAKKMTGPIVLLDHISDPGNLGTIIRTADWFGVQHILLSEESVDIYNPKVVRSSMGSLFHVVVMECGDVMSNLGYLKKEGYSIISLTMSGDALSEFRPKEKTVYIFGSESHGVNMELCALSDAEYSIGGSGKAESLNVGVSVGIVLHYISKK